ncbi:hypothetical protein [Pelomonas sp. SE-A7]|uniref:hypothetical protein n=1 Tax=Pelomonas sp. SE-A7 TaxID=3054953 RepID=UPI00259CD6DD|nr:hypothetical protein [Pelomonas sp. SE-A7]MDM4766508.1 hypothetical protein [Pelomonas sp. SE-A7]
MKRWGGALALLIFSASALAGGEPQVPTLRWLVQDMPPHFSYANGHAPRNADDLGNGEISGFLKLLIQRLPQYRHEFVEAGLPRFETLVRQGETLCSALHLRRPERLEWLYFTELYPPLFSRQIHVVVHKDKLANFELRGQPLQLKELLQRRDLVGLLPRDRAFGGRIDSLLREAGSNAPATVVSGRGMQLLTMLRAHRMDWTLEYPSVVDSLGGGELVSLPLAEGRSTAVATLACSRNAEGKQRIEAIDAAVRKLAQDAHRDAWIRSWRGDSVDEAERRSILRYMDERARGGSRVE